MLHVSCSDLQESHRRVTSGPVWSERAQRSERAVSTKEEEAAGRRDSDGVKRVVTEESMQQETNKQTNNNVGSRTHADLS